MATQTSAQPVIRPPQSPDAVTWLRENLFNNWYNSILTLLSLALIYWGVSVSVKWVFFTADWAPVVRNPLLYAVGQYPREQLWRIGAIIAVVSLLFGATWRLFHGVMRTFTFIYAVFLLAAAAWPGGLDTFTLPMRLFLVANLPVIAAGYLVGKVVFRNVRLLVAAWAIFGLLGVVLLSGFAGSPAVPYVTTGLWGGLLVTLLLSIGGIVLSFPIGVLLALGRRSSLPVIRIFSTIFIEVVRGVPLISIIFLSAIILPLFLPLEVTVDRLVRALAAMTLFSAAYLAENVRGGLQAIPPGQEEAAHALGLSNLQTTYLIVLPQALRLVIPPMVGQFISLFKDTTLATGIGVLEFLSVGRSILQGNPEYIGRQAEVFIFIAVVFWIFCFLMSYASQRLEVALGVGKR